MSKQVMNLENLYLEEAEPQEKKDGISLPEFVEGLKELRRQHNETVQDDTGKTE